MKLTNTSIKKLPLPEKGYRIEWDDTLKGFGCRVTAGGSKAFVAESRVSGKTVRRTVGPFGTLTVEQARKEAKAELGDMARGINRTTVERKQRAESLTLRELMGTYLDGRQTKAGKQLKERTRQDIRRHVEFTFKTWADRPVKSITRDKVQSRYKELCKRSVAQANQSFRVLQALINYAIKSQRTADGERILIDNPVEVLRDVKLLREVPARDRAVPPEKLGQWWAAVQELRHDEGKRRATITAADLIALMALTGLRAGEARAIRWDDVDESAATLTLTDTKNRTDLVLPLSTQALQLITDRDRLTEYVFPGRSGDGYMASTRGPMETLTERTGVEVSPHDLRRTFIRSGTQGCGIELYRVKRLCNHKVPLADVTQANYLGLGSDVTCFRESVQQIGDFYDQQAAVWRAENVVDIKKGRKRA